MATELKLRRGTTAQHSTFTGGLAEVTVDSDKDTVVVHDGATAGGFPLAKETGSNIAAGNLSYTGTLTGSTGVLNIGSGQVYKDASGNVGIGTSSPAQKLQLQTGAGGAILALRGADPAAAVAAPFIQTPVTSGFSDNPVYGFWFQSGLGIANPASNTLAFRTNGSERARIDSSGNLLVGQSSTSIPGVGNTTTGHGFSPNGQASHSTDGLIPGFFNRNSSDGIIVQFRQGGNEIGNIGSRLGSVIYIVLDPRSGGSGFTGSIGSIIPTDGAGDRVDNNIDLGDASFRFDDIYATNGTIQTSDENEKQDIESLTASEKRVAVAAKSLLKKFRWKDAVAEKGEDARIHFGIIAQDLQAAFEAEGLDAGRYAMFINSTWTDEETGEERSRMGVRYSELLAFIIAAI